MTATPNNPPSTPLEPLEQVAAALKRLLADDEQPTPAAVRALTGRLERLGRQLGGAGPAETAALAEQLAQIKRLHDALALRLTQQRDEAGDRLAMMRKGKATLKAYGRTK